MVEIEFLLDQIELWHLLNEPPFTHKLSLTIKTHYSRTISLFFWIVIPRINGRTPNVLNLSTIELKIRSLSLLLKPWTPVPSTPTCYSFISNLSNVEVARTKWSRNKYGNVDQRVEELQRRLKFKFRSRDLNSTSSISGEILLNDILARSESLQKQKAHVNQIRFGDRNTKLFHCKPERNKWRNKIHCLISDEDEIIFYAHDIGVTLLRDWSSIMKSNNNFCNAPISVHLRTK